MKVRYLGEWAKAMNAHGGFGIWHAATTHYLAEIRISSCFSVVMHRVRIGPEGRCRASAYQIDLHGKVLVRLFGFRCMIVEAASTSGAPPEPVGDSQKLLDATWHQQTCRLQRRWSAES